VWLGNARGNAYSRRHVNLTREDDAYWNFSWDQMAAYDLPAAFAYVLAHQPKSYKPQLFYVGHSMGTVMYWASMSERGAEIESAVELMVAMGPVAFVNNMISPIKYLSYLDDNVEVIK